MSAQDDMIAEFELRARVERLELENKALRETLAELETGLVEARDLARMFDQDRVGLAIDRDAMKLAIDEIRADRQYLVGVLTRVALHIEDPAFPVKLRDQVRAAIIGRAQP